MIECQPPICQSPGCSSLSLSNKINIFCADCDIVLCYICYQSHDMSHCILENADINKLKVRKDQVSKSAASTIGFENVNPISIFQKFERKREEKEQIVSRNLMHQLSLMEENCSQESEIIKPTDFNFPVSSSSSNLDYGDSSEQDESDEIIIKMSEAISNQKINLLSNDNSGRKSLSSLERIEHQPPSYFNENENQIVLNESKQQILPIFMNGQGNSSNLITLSICLNNNNQNNQNNNNMLETLQSMVQQGNFILLPQLTSVQQLLLPLDRFSSMIQKIQQNKYPPMNKVNIKAAKILQKKKWLQRGQDDEDDLNDDHGMFGEEDLHLPVLQIKDDFQKSVDSKTLADLKIKAKKLFEDINMQSQCLYKEIKCYVHGFQYERDEIDKVNKYKKYTIEGVEMYFRQLKESFTKEYEKIKKCKKRERLSQMMGKIQKITEQYQFIKEPKDLVSFLSKDYSAYFEEIQDQLTEIQLEGDDIPPQFGVVYENLYDIFDALLNSVSLHLPIKKEYKPSVQPLIMISKSPHSLLPVHYPSVNSLPSLHLKYHQINQKKKIGVWNCKNNELIEFNFEGEGFNELSKYKNFQIVCDGEFLYFIGGQIYNYEKNTFNPSVKSFKMNLSNGEVVPLCDMISAKMKFGITITSSYIFTFGGLQTSEKYRSNSCECYDIAQNTWKTLPLMQRNRVSPLVCLFMKEESENVLPFIYLLGGMEDKNNISYCIEVMDANKQEWVQYYERPANSKCYIPKQLGYAIQINQEQILITGGMSGRKQKPTNSLQVYNISKNSISNLSIDSLPIGVLQDLHAGQPIIYNKSVFILNTQVSQYFPVLKQLEGVFNILKIGLNQQEIIQTCCI